MGKGGGGAVAYPTTKSDSALWGSSTTSGSGISFTPTKWQEDLMSTTGNSINNTLKDYLNPSYSSEDYLAQKAQRQKDTTEMYDNAVLNPLSKQGLMRSSGLQASTNAFNEALADQEANALSQYKQGKLTDLSTLLGLSTDLYNYSQGENKLSSGLANSVANYNLQNQAMKNASDMNTFGLISSGIGQGMKLAGLAGMMF